MQHGKTRIKRKYSNFLCHLCERLIRERIVSETCGGVIDGKSNQWRSELENYSKKMVLKVGIIHILNGDGFLYEN